MGRFRSDRSDNRSSGFRDRGRSRDSDNFSGRSERGGFRDRDSRRRAPEMHNVICDKCGKECQVPFKPTSDKPVFCSDCFRKDDSGPRRSFNSRESSGSAQSGISQDQFKQINAKLDKIIQILESDLEELEEDEEEE
ncbi:hypothetical protein J4404_00275 [Candidatus Woesearchaeota archaeon]|nr:hypothetical protein [Candidatus Woesearchaeota archaeon]